MVSHMAEQCITTVNKDGSVDWASVFSNAIKMSLPNQVRSVEIVWGRDGPEVRAIINNHEGHISIPFTSMEEVLDKLRVFC